MSFSIMGAILLAASAAANPADYLDTDRFDEQHEKRGVADKVLSAVAGAAMATAVYRMSDSDDVFEYYPLSVRATRAGFDFSDTLSVDRGGFRFQLSTIRQGANGPADPLAAIADYRKDSRKMRNAMPGYPQPPRIVVGLKISY